MESPKCHANEKWVAVSIANPSICDQRADDEREHRKDRSDVVAENNRGRAYAIFCVFISVLILFVRCTNDGMEQQLT